MRARSKQARNATDDSRRWRLEEEIASLEKRLAQLGPDGDCGYEKALIRFFEQQLIERRASLQRFD